jgi:hypothetical protein
MPYTATALIAQRLELGQAGHCFGFQSDETKTHCSDIVLLRGPS